MSDKREMHGFGLIEVMVTAAIGSVLMLGLSSMISYQNKSVQSIRTSSTRDQLAIILSKVVGDYQALSNSANYTGTPFNFDSNAAFKNCVIGSSLGCIGGTAQTLALLDRGNHVWSGSSATNALSFTTEGAPCANISVSPASAQCPLIAYASFTATCPGGTSPCNIATQVDVTYVIKQAYVGSGLNKRVGGTLKDVTVTVTLPVPLTVAGNSTGTPGFLGRWTTATNIGTSSIYEASNGNIGLGTTSPGNTLHVVSANTNNGITIEGPATANNTTALSLKTNVNPAGSYNPVVQAGDALLSYSGVATTAPNGLVIAPYNPTNSAAGGLRLDKNGVMGLGGTNSNVGQVLMTDNFTEHLATFGTGYSGLPVMGFAVAPSNAGLGGFNSTVSTPAFRSAIELSGVGVSVFESVAIAAPIGTAVTMNEVMRVTPYSTYIGPSYGGPTTPTAADQNVTNSGLIDAGARLKVDGPLALGKLNYGTLTPIWAMSAMNTGISCSTKGLIATGIDTTGTNSAICQCRLVSAVYVWVCF